MKYCDTGNSLTSLAIPYVSSTLLLLKRISFQLIYSLCNRLNTCQTSLLVAVHYKWIVNCSLRSVRNSALAFDVGSADMSCEYNYYIITIIKVR